MKNIRGNLWDHLASADALCITTNGYVNSGGKAVMGRGCAKEAVENFPGINARLGYKLRRYGNHVFLLVTHANFASIVSFPVKPRFCTSSADNVVGHMRSIYPIGNSVPGWACVASLDIIEQSCKELSDMADAEGWGNIVLPRPGCGAGELKWSDVEPVLAEYLDDRFSIITF